MTLKKMDLDKIWAAWSQDTPLRTAVEQHTPQDVTLLHEGRCVSSDTHIDTWYMLTCLSLNKTSAKIIKNKVIQRFMH